MHNTYTLYYTPDKEVSDTIGAATPTASPLGSVEDKREAAAGVSPEVTVLDCLGVVGDFPL